jgi:omega-amidase
MEIKARPFRLALLQLASLSGNKKNNILVARAAVLAASKSTPKPDLIVLPEIWNSPYAVPKFREYSEKVPEVGSDGKGGEGEGEGETISALREMAKEAGCWLIGGKFLVLAHGLGESMIGES